MTITLFTSNQPRHTSLIERLAGLADRLFVVQECNTVFPGQVDDFFRKSEVMQRYFARVIAAERETFGVPRFPMVAGNVRSLPIRMGDLSRLPLDAIEEALRADAFLVFGASYIRGPLCDALVERRAVNIHMGVSPQYRGSSTNFWPLYDGRPEFVGATIHRLTAGLDSGPILFHALPAAEAVDPFLLGMRAVRAAHEAVHDAIRTGEIAGLSPEDQDRSRELRYSRNADFTDAIAAEYLERAPSREEIGRRLAARDLADFIRARIGPPGPTPTTPLPIPF